MSFPRQNKLNPILIALQSIPGILLVTQDDWDSNSIRVHLTLHFINGKPVKPLNGITKAIRKMGIRITDYPVKVREYNGKFQGKTIWFDKGYDQQTISVEVRV